MAGHSQFKNIMHRKGAQDAKRSRVFSKLVREITVAAKQGLPDAEHNPRLRAAVLAARAQNMTKDAIERAIKRSQGADSENYEEIRYEGYGPGGIAVVVEALTDNRNRTASDVRSIFSKHGGGLGETGSVSFMFARVGEIRYPADRADEERALEAAIEAGADECLSGPDGHEILTSLEAFNSVREALEKELGEPESARLVWRPGNTVPVGEDDARTLFKMLDALDDHDDIQNVFANFDVADDVMAKLSV